MSPEQGARQQELDQIAEFMRRKPHRIYRAAPGETSGWDDLTPRQKRERQYRKSFGGFVWKKKHPSNVPIYAPVRAR